jgi:drug/metabolite transporter (DMT)-like permease
VASGVIAVGGALLFLLATGHGELSIVAVVTALYPAFTVLLARVVLSERWSSLQVAGLLVAAASVVLVSLS